MKKIRTLFIAALLLTAFTGCAASSSGASPQEPPAADCPAEPVSEPDFPVPVEGNSILVNSSEEVSVVPDIAEVVYSVRSSAGDPASCQQKNSEAVSQVIDCLRSLEVAETSIQTTDYYMNPVYNYSGNTARITGYESVTTLTVSDLPLRGPGRLDEILSQSVITGVNTIQSITYQASLYDQCYQEALEAAVRSARQKAQALADAAGCNVGAVLNITETSGYSQARYSDYALASQYNARKEAALEDTAGIMPGELQVEARITVEYQLY